METSLLKQMATIFCRAENSIMNLTESLGSFQKLLIFLAGKRIELKLLFMKRLQKSLCPFSPPSFFLLFLFFIPALKQSTGIPDSNDLLD